MSDGDYLHNAWYMVGWAHELDDGALIGRRVLETPVVVFRDSNGVAQALVNRCPHRFAPLSRGKVVGDAIQCGYHGLAFDGTGRCVRNPYDQPDRDIRVRRFPLVERYRMIWLWFGHDARADAALIPDFPFHEDPRYRFVYGHSEIKANYELVTDNLLDLSHTTYIHPGFGGENWVPEFEMEQQGERVIARYRIPDAPPSEFSEGLFPAQGRRLNEYTTMRWDAPCTMRLDIGVAFSDAPDDVVATQPSTHVLAPATDESCWYFWASGVEQSAPVTDDIHRAALIRAFEVEDAPMLEACHESMDGQEFWSRQPVILKYDASAVRARKILRRKIREEQAAATAKSA